MAKKKSGKKTTKVRNLPVRKASGVKGGSAIGDAIKAVGGAISTVAKGQSTTKP